MSALIHTGKARLGLISLLGLCLVFSCQPQESFPDVPSMPDTIDAVCGENWVPRQGWTPNDAINVFGAEGESERYVFDAELNAFARFTDGRSYPEMFDGCYAVSPFDSSTVQLSEGRFAVKVPRVQYYDRSGISRSSDILVGASEGLSDCRMALSSVLGYLKLTLAGSMDLKSITLRSNGGETLCGPAVVAVSHGKIPSLNFAGAGACDSLVLDCSGLDASSVETEFYFGVPAGTYSKGFSLAFTDAKGKASPVEYPDAIEVVRGRATELNRVGTGTSLLSLSLRTPDGVEYKCMDVLGPALTVCVPIGTDPSRLIPVFSHDGQSVSVSGKELRSGRDELDFSSPLKFVVSGGGDTRSYTVSVVDFDLPVVYVSTPGHETIADKETWHYESTFIIQNPDGTIEDYGSAGIKGRGNASWKREKKSYGIKLAVKPKDRTVLGMPGHKRWCIIAIQWGYLGNNVGYELARRTASFAWQPHGRYVEFVLNGEHRGTYFLAEQIRIDKNRVDIKSLDPDEIGEDKISGGYLLTYDRTFNDPNKFKSKYFDMPVMIKDPDDDDLQPEQFAWIENYINDMEDAMKDAKRFAKREYLDYFDIDTYIDMWFVWELAGATGSHGGADFAHPNSVWFHKDRGGKLKAGPCWDFDSYLFSNQDLKCNDCQYYGRLFQDPAFVARVKEKWPEFRASVEGKGKYRTPITEFIDSCYNTVLYSAKRNQKMFGWTMFKYDEEYKTIREGLPAKMDWLEEQIMGFK